MRLLRRYGELVVALPLFAGVAWVALLVVYGHFYDQLGLRPADVGLDRGALLGDAAVGAGAMVLLVGVIAAVSTLAVAVAGALGVPLVRIAGRLLAAAPFLPTSYGDRLRKLTRRRIPNPFPFNDALRVWAALVPPTALVALYALAGDSAMSVRAGLSNAGSPIGGLPLLQVRASQFGYDSAADQRMPDAACELFLGNGPNGRVFFNTIRQRAETSMSRAGTVLGGMGRTPPRCRPSAARQAHDVPLVGTHDVVQLDGGSGLLTWTQRRPGGRADLYAARTGGPVRLVEGSLRTAPNASVGRDRAGAVVSYRRCRVRCEQVAWSFDGRRRSVRLPSPPPGCRVSATAVWLETRAWLLRGARCGPGDRGLWWARFGAKPRRAALTASRFAARSGRLAWTESDRGISSVHQQRWDADARTVYRNDQQTTGAAVTVGAPIMLGSKVAWGVSVATGDRRTMVLTAGPADRCLVLERDLPVLPSRTGTLVPELALLAEGLVYADQNGIARRPATTPATISRPEAIGRMGPERGPGLGSAECHAAEQRSTRHP